MSWAVVITSLFVLGAPERVGLFVGSNGAPPGRTPLVHAEADAQAMRRVFVELGEVPAEAAHLLEGPTADAVLAAITESAKGARVFVFYYSGHADQRALLLEGSELPFAELERALAATGAELRIELIDACRAGAMTRSKGATLGERLRLEEDAGTGRVVLASSAEWEDSHESDALGASFFTLHLASGLRGAADADGDARVTLSEAYQYVYARTVESTLGTGTQHPTYAYALSGRGELVLTWPERSGGQLRFDDADYVVIDRASGRVVAELRPPARTLAVPVGAYRVHKRTRHEVSSGTVHVARGGLVDVEPFLDERVAHARLVRKGGDASPSSSHAVRLELGLRGPVGDVLPTAPLARVGWELALPWVSLMPFVSTTLLAPLESPRLSWRAHELGVGVRATRAIDTSLFTVRGGLGVEALRLGQSERQGLEPRRTSYGLALSAGLGVDSPPLVGALFLTLGVEAALYAYRGTDAIVAPAGTGELETRPTVRVSIGVGHEL